MDKFKRLLTYVYPYRFILVVSVLAAVFMGALEGGQILFVKYIVDNVLLDKNHQLLWMISAAVIGIVVVKGVLSYVNAYLVSYVGNRVIMNIRNQLYQHIQGLSLDFFNQNSTGILMSKVLNDVGMLSGLVSIAISLVKEPISAFWFILVALYMDWKLALASFVVLPLIALLIAKVGRVLRRYGRIGQQWIAEMTQLLQETFSGIRIVKAFSMEKHESKRFYDETDRLFKLSMKAIKVASISSPLIEVIGSFAAAFIIIYGGTRVIQGYTTPGELAAFVIAIAACYKPIRRLNRLNVQIQAALASAERVFEVLDTKPSVTDKPTAIEFNETIREVRFENVAFRYEDQWVLEDINLSVRPGEVVAFVGSSGAGKTTLVNLLPRFYDVTQGVIYFNDYNICDLKITSLRKQFAIVTQESFLFDDTVRNNILYGDFSKSEDDVIKAAKAANAYAFIQNLPKGLETTIGERGVKLSGGQKQRLCIARALLKDAPLLILDEATSSLDTESEREVQQALETLMQGRTTFVIAHRLSTIQKADRIMVLAQGRIVETGQHRQLIQGKGIYKRLFELQFAE